LIADWGVGKSTISNLSLLARGDAGFERWV